VTTSTAEVSENALPVSRVSILASSSFRARSNETAFRRILDLSMGGVLDQVGNADRAAEIAASIDDWDDV